jgi:hypothetical protein
MQRNRLFAYGLVALITLGVGSLVAQTDTQSQRLYATLQKPGIATGYVSGALKIGPESTSGFFIVTGETMRLGNADYQIGENTEASTNGKTYSLRDASGRFLVCCNDAALSVSANPADGAQWFRIRFYTAAQKTEIENRRRATAPR